MSAAPALTAEDLELEHAELLPARETLLVPRFNRGVEPWGPVHPHPAGPGHFYPMPSFPLPSGMSNA